MMNDVRTLFRIVASAPVCTLIVCPLYNYFSGKFERLSGAPFIRRPFGSNPHPTSSHSIP